MRASAISEQSGWWPTVTTVVARACDGGDEVVCSRARCEPLVDAELGAGRLRDRGGRLAGAEERAREDEIRLLPCQALAERPRLVAAAGAERAQLVRVAGIGVGVTDEDQAHEAGG